MITTHVFVVIIVLHFGAARYVYSMRQLEYMVHIILFNQQEVDKQSIHFNLASDIISSEFKHPFNAPFITYFSLPCYCHIFCAF
jgi:hypothetical protein